MNRKEGWFGRDPAATKETLLFQLKACDERIERCERVLARQRQLIRDLERDGHRITEAVAILQNDAMALSASMAERERLRTMLNT